MAQKKTLLVTEPLQYTEYNDKVDIKFDKNGEYFPIICVPIINKEE